MRLNLALLLFISLLVCSCKPGWPTFWKKSAPEHVPPRPEVERSLVELTDNYTTLPSSDEVNDEINRSLMGPTISEANCPVELTQEATTTEGPLEERSPAQSSSLEIISKAQWNARALKKDGSFKCMDYRSMATELGIDPAASEEELLKSVYQNGRIVIHHAASNATIKSIQDAHIDGRGLQDMAYHFFIDRQGKIYEGRSLGLMGAHAGSLNESHYQCVGNIKAAHVSRDYDFKSIGIVLSGNLEVRSPPEIQYQALKGLVSHLAQKYKISLIGGHEHYRAGGTDCPGAQLIDRLNHDSDIQLEPPVNKSQNFFEPDFVCESESITCR